jgi:hypothetical protein
MKGAHNRLPIILICAQVQANGRANSMLQNGGYFVWVGVVAEQIAGGLAGLGQGVPVMIRL